MGDVSRMVIAGEHDFVEYGDVELSVAGEVGVLEGCDCLNDICGSESWGCSAAWTKRRGMPSYRLHRRPPERCDVRHKSREANPVES
jgi:hypothetical protein